MATSDTGEATGPIPGKTVLITGGRRVGGELALLLADRGWDVAMTYHTSRETIERTIAAVEGPGPRGAGDRRRPLAARAGRGRRPAGREPFRPARCAGEHGQRLPPHAAGDALPARLRHTDRRQPGGPVSHGRRRRPGDAPSSPARTGSRGRSSTSATGRPSARTRIICPTWSPRGA